ncbi:hypothetical protein [Pseudocitrobacter faecalis]|uniref:hypothetical protein n=1 Tax=Pseudocitrobacter faecalis TaxID=1398493 RepID=UPI0040634927
MTQSKKSGNFMVVGKTGEGKTESMAQMVRIFMAQSDVSQIKDQYDNEDGKSGYKPSLITAAPDYAESRRQP